MTTQYREMIYKGKTIPIRLKFNHWFPKMLGGWVGAVTIGTSMYFKRSPREAHIVMFAHECLHVASFLELEKRTWRQSYKLALMWWLLRYFWDFVTSGFRYQKMKEESNAYDNQWIVLNGEHPDIKIHWATVRRQMGYNSLE